jgi:hypothetical protein
MPFKILWARAQLEIEFGVDSFEDVDLELLLQDGQFVVL